jgi:hypothetical protein
MHVCRKLLREPSRFRLSEQLLDKWMGAGACKHCHPAISLAATTDCNAHRLLTQPISHTCDLELW